MDKVELKALVEMNRNVMDWREPIALAAQEVLRGLGGEVIWTTDLIRKMGVDPTAERSLAGELNKKLHALKGGGLLAGWWRHSKTDFVKWAKSDGEKRPLVEWLYDPLAVALVEVKPLSKARGRNEGRIVNDFCNRVYDVLEARQAELLKGGERWMALEAAMDVIAAEFLAAYPTFTVEDEGEEVSAADVLG